MLPLHRFALRCFALVCLSVALPNAHDTALAQSSASKPLIVEKVNESQLVKLEGNTPPAAIAQNDRGRVSPAMPMTDLILVLRRSPEQQAAFDDFVASQYDATSPNFHHWLAPEEVGEKFGPASADIGTVSSWLSSHGFSVDEVSKDRMTIRFSGSAAQVEETFHTEIHNLVVKGELHISNMSDPQIPMALEPVVLGPKALHNFTPRPLHRTGSSVTLNRETGKWERVPVGNATSASPRPEMGFGCGTNCQVEDVAPYDFAAIYNVLPLWNSSIDGTGQTIAIAGRSDVRAADVATFRSAFGLPVLKTGQFKVINNGTDPGFCTTLSGLCTLDDQVENALDVEWSSAVATGATIDLVVTEQTTTNDAIFQSAQYVIQNVSTLGATILNVSYGQCELFLGTSGNTAYNGLWQSAATQGIAVFVATGDSGSPSCDQGGDASGTPYGATFGLSVSGIASTQYNTAVGGTDLNWGSTAAPYWNSTNSGTNGSSAKGYIPEVPWNDTCTNPIIVSILNGELGKSLSANQLCDEIATHVITSGNEQALLDLVDTIGGSGGASNCTVNSTTSTTALPDPTSCSGGYAKPSWQTGVTGIPTDGKRDIPDVSFFAGNGFLGTAYLICVSDTGTCVASATSTTEPSGEEVGGTSVASPAMAGVMALINQKAGTPQGNPNSQLYKLAGQQTYASCSTETVTSSSSSCYFNDIDTGTIAMPCAANSPNCTLAATGNAYGELTGFAAGTGYDEATGLGSLNVANVVNAWLSSTGTATATVAVAATPGTISVDQTTSVTATVTGASGTPTGKVYLSGAGYISGSSTLVSGSFTFTIPANSLNGGTDTLTAHYSGDPTYAPATGTVSVTVNKLTPSVAVVASPTTVNATIKNVNVSVAITGAGLTPTGTVQLSGGGYTSTACTLAAGDCTITVPSNKLSNGSDTLTVTYSGDASYVTATGSATVTVSAYTPTVTVTPSTGTIAKASSLTVVVAVTGTNGTATGSVQLSGGGYTSALTTLTGGSATITIPGGNLSGGADTLTANYSGDTTYFSTTGTAIVTVTVPTPTVTVTPADTSIDAGQTLNVTVAVAGTGSPTPTGTVTLSGGGYTASAQTLASGSATISIPANSLSVGTDSLNVSYSGDGNYTAVTGSANVTVAASAYALAGTAPAAVSPGTSATSTVSVSSSTFYTGTVTLTCALTTSPAGASHVPGCSVSGGGNIVVNAGTPGGTGTVTVTTTAATSSSMNKPHIGAWNEAEGGAVLALLMLFGIPARRRGWRAMLGAVVLLATLGSLAACGGGGGSSSTNGGGSGSGTPGTTAGSYTFTVTGTGNDPAKTKVTTTFTLTVN